MAQKTIRCTLVTPSAKLLDEPITYASIPAWDGLFGVLPGRAPIVAELGTGELRFEFPDTTTVGGDRAYFIHGGFVKMSGDTLTILAETAIPAEQLSETTAAADLAAAEALTIPASSADPGLEADKIGSIRNAARMKLAIARKYKGKGI